MDMIELGQLDQHDFDLRIRDREDCSPEVFLSAYHEYLTGEPLTDEYVNRFEKVLAGLIGSNIAHAGLLHEMDFAGVEPLDAVGILRDGPVPSDAVMDAVAALRAAFDEAAELYAEQLQSKALVAPVNPNPTEEEVAQARTTLARYVVAAILTDTREENDQ